MRRSRGRISALVVGVLAAACTSSAGETSLPTPSTSERTAPVPRSGRLVFAREGDIWSIRADGTHERQLTRLAGDQFDPDWSPDGGRIVFRDSRNGVNVNDEIAVMDSDGDNLRVLTAWPSDEWGPAWSPDGSRIAFSSGRDGIMAVWVMNADGSGAKRLSDVEGEYPTWSPDGSRIAFASSMGGQTPFGDPDYDVWVMNADGSGATNLTNDSESYDMYPTWSPRGDWIAFESTRATPEDFEPPAYDLERISDFDIWVMRPDGSDATDLTKDATKLAKFPDWSPDGSRIAFDREGTVVIVNADGSGRFDVTLGGFPAWGPIGQS